MPGKRLLPLVVSLLAAASTFARPRLVPIEHSFIGAAASSNPTSFVRVGAKAYFRANDGIHGQELWGTDGTTPGTTLVADINPGPASSNPMLIGSIGPKAILTASDTISATLWATNETGDGIVRLMTLPSLAASRGTLTTVAADTLAFVLIQQGTTAPTEIVVTDGTEAGTRKLGAFPVYPYVSPVGAGGRLLFTSVSDALGSQLWVSDGTASGTRMVRRGAECPGPSCGPAAKSLFRFGTHIGVVTPDGLWITDGTSAGTKLLASMHDAVQLASSPSSPIAYLVADGMLWRTDGTEAGTRQVRAVTTPLGIVADDGRLLFYQSVSGGFDLWRSDGTPDGTMKIGTLPVRSSLFLPLLGTLGDRVFLAGGTMLTGAELWVADLQTGALGLLQDLDPRRALSGGFSSSPGAGIRVGSTFLFPATDLSGRELWRTDGTAGGSSLVANLAADPGGGVVSGTVRAAVHGVPLEDMTVYLCNAAGTAPCDTTLSDANGRYHFDGVIPGTYSLAADGHSYVGQSYDGVDCPCPSGSATPVAVSSGLETAGIDFSLIRGGTIGGRTMLAASGEPVETMRIVIHDSTGAIADSTLTLSDGRYESRGLRPGTYSVEAINTYNPGVVSQVYRNRECATTCDWHIGDPIFVTNEVNSGNIDFALRTFGTIAGTVRDDAGSPVPAIAVGFLEAGKTEPANWVNTDGNGAYRSPLLPAGAYYVVAGGARGFNAVVHPNGTCDSPTQCTPSGGTVMNVATGSTMTGIDLQLTMAKARLTGTIRDRNGAPFFVELRLLNAAGLPLGPSVYSEGGRYELANLPEGTYYLQAGDELYPGVDCLMSPCSVAGATPLVLTNGHTTRADMQLRSQLTSFSGHVTDAVNGEPLAASIEIVSPSGAILSSTLAGSTYTIGVISRATTFYLAASAPGHHRTVYNGARWECTGAPCPLPAGATLIPAGTNPNIDLALQRQGSINGTVRDTAGKPLADVQIHVYPAGSSSVASVGHTDLTGHYTIYPPLPGSYRAYAAPLASNSYRSQVFRDRDCTATCEPATGDAIPATDGLETTGIDFHLAPSSAFGTINGHVYDADTGLPIPDARVTVNQAGLAATTDGQGFYSISHDERGIFGLTSGSYTLHVAPPMPYLFGLSGGGSCVDFYACYDQGAPVQVTSPSSTTVDFRVPKLRIFSIEPAVGPTTGGTQVVIRGAHFTPSAKVTIAGRPATVISMTPTEIVAVTPPGPAGDAHITIRLSDWVYSTLVQAYRYLPAGKPRAVRSSM